MATTSKQINKIRAGSEGKCCATCKHYRPSSFKDSAGSCDKINEGKHPSDFVFPYAIALCGLFEKKSK